MGDVVSIEIFWICDYGAITINDTPKPRLIGVDKDFNSIVREIPLIDVLEKSDNLQGVAYDKQYD